MRLMLVAFVLSLGLYSTASAGTIWSGVVELTQSEGQDASQSFAMYTQSDNVSGPIGAFSFIQATPTWAQGYVGAAYPINAIWSAGLGLGVEQNDDGFKPRLGAFTTVYHPRYFMLGIYERGEGEWYRFQARRKFTNGLQLGLAAERILGPGLTIGWASPKLIWWLPTEVLMTVYSADGHNTNVVAINKAFP